jgi:Na+/phosphate symporter
MALNVSIGRRRLERKVALAHAFVPYETEIVFACMFLLHLMWLDMQLSRPPDKPSNAHSLSDIFTVLLDVPFKLKLSLSLR